MPKQFCRMLGGRSLLELTIERARGFTSLNRVLVVVNNDHKRFSEGQLDALPPANVISQPCNRDTGPGILFALQNLERRDPGAIVAMMPSDQFASAPL